MHSSNKDISSNFIQEKQARHTSIFLIKMPGFTPVPTRVTLEFSRVTLGFSRVTLDFSRVSLGFSSLSLGYSSLLLIVPGAL